MGSAFNAYWRDFTGKDGNHVRLTGYLNKCLTHLSSPVFQMDGKVIMINQIQMGHLSSDPDSQGPKPGFSQLHPSSRTKTPNASQRPRLCLLRTDLTMCLDSLPDS